MKKLVLWFILILSYPYKLYAAEVSLIDNNIIAISGPIKKGDLNRLKNVARHIPYGQGILLLNSQGGAAYEGIYMGEYIRQYGFATAVLPGNNCYSACAIMWAAGNQKFAALPDSVIGFHAIYNSYTKNEVGHANAKLGAVLGRWGYSDDAIEFMTIKGASQFSYLNFNTASLYDIQYTDLGELTRYQPKTNYNLSPFDVVLGFYSALSIADGDLAAAYVIPEKRGIGPFNQTNIYKFYSSMREPLKVHNIKPINTEQFEVDYSFTKTKTQCRTTARITVTNYNGYNLIKSIKAKC